MPTYLLSFVLFVAGCPLIEISIRFLTGYFDPFTLIAGRFLGGVAALLMATLWFHRSELRALLLKPACLRVLLIAACCFAVSQVGIVNALQHTTATMVQTLCLLSFPLSVLFSAIFYSSERKVLKQRCFQIGAPLTVLSALGLTLHSADGTFELTWVALILVGAICSNIIGTLIAKRELSTLSPFLTGLVVASYQLILFTTISIWIGDWERAFQAPLMAWITLFLSGAVGMSLGIGLAFTLIRRHGIIVERLLSLLFPVSGAALEYLLLGDQLSVQQYFWGTAMIFGSVIALGYLRQQRTAIEPATPHLSDQDLKRWGRLGAAVE